MIIKFQTTGGKEISLDDTDFAPPSLGDFLATVLEARELSPEDVASKAAINTADVHELIKGQRLLDKATARKLERVFPRASRSLLKIQEQYQFYQKYHRLRPDSPLQRLWIERRHNRFG